MKFVATSDWQLGMTAHYLAEGARHRFHQARLDAVAAIGDVVRAEGAQFVTVAGDIFETNQLDRAIVRRAFESLQQIPVPVFLVPGNHDPLDVASIYDSPDFLQFQPDNVVVLRDSTPYAVAPGVEVVGVPWFSKHPTTDLVAQALQGLPEVPEDTVRILVAHGAVDNLAGSADRAKLDVIKLAPVTAALESGQIHFVALGDRHGTYEVAPQIWYSGSPEVTSRRDVDPGNVLVVTVAAQETPVAKVRSVPVGTWDFATVSATLNSDEQLEDFAARLAAYPRKSSTALWLALEGSLTTTQRARLDVILEEASELFARIDLWLRHTDLVVVPDDADFAQLQLHGYAKDALDELVVAAASPDDAQATLAQDALSLLYRMQGDHR